MIIICEPDGTYQAKDTLKLLKYIDKYDMVAGSRTNPKYIRKNSNMGIILRFGNVILAKLIQILFLTNSISDCGCTFRVIKKSQLRKFEKKFTVGKSYFLPELVILNRLNDGTHFEVPVTYSKRIGTSKITGSKTRSIIVGLQMFKLILYYRIGLIKNN